MSNPLDTLIAQLQSPDVRQRSQAVLQLQPGTPNDDRAITALVGVLSTDDDLNVIEDATWVLGRYGTAATSALLNAMPDANARVRHNIVHALGKIADVRALPVLLTATHDADPAVRLKSVVALGQMGDTQAIEPLIARLDDPVQDIRWAAREVLETFGRNALPHLIQALAMESAQVRELAASLLGELADVRAVDPLIAAIETDDWHVRFAIIEALGHIGDMRALPIIEQLVNDPHSPVRAMANTASKMLNKRKN